MGQGCAQLMVRCCLQSRHCNVSETPHYGHRAEPEAQSHHCDNSAQPTEQPAPAGPSPVTVPEQKE